MTKFRTEQLENLAASDIITGQFADTLLSESSITQHEAALTITESQISDLGTYSTATGVENNADVTDATNVTAAGALMESEVDADIKTLTIAASSSISGTNTGDETDMTSTVGGLVPTPPNNTTTFLRGDGTFAAPAGGGGNLGDGSDGDVTISTPTTLTRDM